MTDPAPDPAVHDTFVLEHRYAAPPARVFAAFADPALKRGWCAEGGAHDVEAYALDFQVGGLETARYRFKGGGPFAGVGLAADGVHLDIVPEARIVMASTMALGGHRISASLLTIELAADGEGGTRLVLTHQGAFFEGADGPEMRRDGWRHLLRRLDEAVAA
ncbi:MAG: SRPBCC family protein [Caulobacter sp.]|nr:SRPBCC family protein [Caulobacter sp.]